MRAGPTISVFISTLNISIMSCIEVHKRELEKQEPQTKILHNSALFTSFIVIDEFQVDTN